MTKKYRIKNEAVEKAVRGLFVTQEAFEKQLNAWSEYHFKYYSNYSCIKIVANSAESITGYACELYVATSDIEEVVEYDPNGWNEMSVKPPANGQYLVYCKSDKSFSIWRKDGDLWVNPTGFSRRYDNGILEHFKYRSFDSLKAIELEDEE